MAFNLGDLIVKIGADVSGLKQGMSDANRQIAGLNVATQTATSFLKGFAASVISVGTVALAINFVRGVGEAIDAQSKLARSLGGSVEGVQALEHAADLAGISSGELATSMQALNQRLGEAARSASGPAYEALRRLGLTAQELSALDVDERLATIAKRADELGLSAQATADLLRQLGVRSKDMTNLLEGGGAAIVAARQEIRDLGLAVDDVSARQIEQFNDQMTRIGKIAQGVATRLMVELAPALTVIANNILDAGKSGGGFGASIEAGVQLAVKAFAALQVEIYKTRVGLDDAIAETLNLFDNVAGFIPRTIEKWTGGAISASDLGFKAINESWGKLRESLGEAPSIEKLTEHYNRLIGLEKLRTAFEAEEAKKRNDNRAVDTKVLTEEETKKYQEKLDRLTASLAGEEEKIRLSQEKRLRDLAELENAGIVTTEQAAKLRQKILQDTTLATTQYVNDTVLRGLLTDEEQLMLSHERQLAAIDEFEAGRADRAVTAANFRLRLEQMTAQRTLEIHARQYSTLASIVDSAMSNIGDIMETEGEKQFGITKAIAMASALVHGFEASVAAYKAGAAVGGPILGATFAAIAAASTAAIIAKLAGVTSNSKGTPSVGGGSGGGGGAVGGGGNRVITVQGVEPAQLFTGQAVRGMINSINEEVKDGAVVRTA